MVEGRRAPAKPVGYHAAMLSSALRFVLALLMLAGYVPVPANVAGGRGAGSCCAPKACCMARGAACHGSGACESGAAGSGAAGLRPILLAGGCGMPVPRITPVTPDPVVGPRSDAEGAPWGGVGSRIESLELVSSGITPDPSVPPPRA